MNGFANAILTLLLGWLRSLFSTLWIMLGSDGGNAVVTFLRANWKTLFLILCVGGFVVDRFIYLLRWRPYYVWQARRARRRRGWEDEPDGYDAQPYGEGDGQQMPQDAYGDGYAPAGGGPYQPMPTARYRPQPSQQHGAPTYRYAPQPRRHTDSYPAERPYVQGPTRPYGQPAMPQQGAQGEPLTYMPGASYAPTAAYQPQAYQPPEVEPFEGEPRFDDDLAGWNAPGSAYDGFAPRLSPEHNLAYGLDSSFGAPQPEPTDYLHSMQAAYAPPPAYEQRYAPPPGALAPENGTRFDAAEPDHPGLDAETFQQHIGLTGNPAAGMDAAPDGAYAGFAPFNAVDPQEGPLSKPRGLSALAKKARSLVSGEDERNPRTIRDLQPAADVKSAFRAPVYPQKPPGSEDDA